MLARDMSTWEELHISPCAAPSQGAKLCTYLRWFALPDKLNTEPCYEVPLLVTKLRSVVQIWVGGCSLLANQAGQDWEAQG